MFRGIRVPFVVCASLAVLACASSEELERTGDSGLRSDGAGASPVGSGGGPRGTGGTGGGGGTTTTGGGGVGGASGTGGSSGTGGTGVGGATGTGGTTTGGTGGAAGGIQDASLADRPTPIDAGTCTTCKLRVQYRASDTNAADNQVKPHFNIVNVGTTGVPLSELTIRYWYTVDGDRPQVHWCDYAVIGCSNVTGKFVKLSTPEQGADSYLEIGFGAGAGTLSGNGQTGEIQSRFNKDDYSNYNEADDYSFDPGKTAFADWMRVTLYHNGGLVWGIDPECANPRDGSMCGADASTDADPSDAGPDVVSTDVSIDIASTDVALSDVATESGPTDGSSTDGPSDNDSGAVDTGGPEF